MANMQHVAERIFRHVDAGHLPAGYANCMGALIDAYGATPARDDDLDFHEWADKVQGSAIEKLIACMVRQGSWDNPAWLREYVWEERQREGAA
jgi:hypothetical protein